jgi:hypothetical protein
MADGADEDAPHYDGLEQPPIVDVESQILKLLLGEPRPVVQAGDDLGHRDGDDGGGHPAGGHDVNPSPAKPNSAIERYRNFATMR